MSSIWKEDTYRQQSFDHVPSTGQVSCVVGRDVYVLGGRRKISLLQNCVCKYNLDTKEWVTVKVIGDDLPDGFWSGAVALPYKDVIYIYGGHIVGKGYQASLQAFNTHTREYRVIQTTGVAPSPRDKHAGVIYEGCLYYFGGWGKVANGFTWAGGLWKYNICANEWSFVTTKGQPPSPRAAHTMTLIPGSCQDAPTYAYVIGGRCEGGRNNEVHRLDMLSMQWTGPLVAAAAPSSSSCSVFSVERASEPIVRAPNRRKSSVIDVRVQLSETVSADGRSSEDERISTDLSSYEVGSQTTELEPCGRSWHIAEYLDSRRILVHGGMSNGIGLEVGTSLLTVNGGPGHALGDTWVFDVDTHVWTCVESTGQARLWHSSCIDRDKGEVLYFSGHSNFEHGVLRDVENDRIARFQYRPRSLIQLSSDLVAQNISEQIEANEADMSSKRDARKSAEDVLRVEVRRGSMSAKAASQISESFLASSAKKPGKSSTASTGHMRSVWDVRHRLTI